MGPRTATVQIGDLLAHRAWVRGLALALTRDADDADDVEQQTWLAALRNPPRAGVPPRGWLTTVVRNAARQRWRATRRRTLREATVARPETAAAGDPAELTARAELHVRVASAVVALDEPYRRSILLRHFEDRSVSEVARATGVPLETARARLRRGRAMLRERLVSELGDGRSLAVMLLPLTTAEGAGAGNVAAMSATTAGSVMMVSTKIATGCALAALIGGTLWWAMRDREHASQAAPSQAAAAPRDSGQPETATVIRRREHVATTTTAPPEPELPATRTGPTLEARLARRVRADYASESLRRVLGRISAETDVPIHAQSAVLAHLDGDDALVSLRLQERMSGRRVLGLVTSFRGLAFDVMDDRVVIRRSGDEPTTDGTSTFVIDPVPVDIDAPTTLTIRARILHADGAPAVGATLEGQGATNAVADVAGYVEFETAFRESRLRAVLPFYERSATWRAKGDFGVLLEPEFVLGRPAAAVIVTVTSGGELLDGATVCLSWSVPSETGGGQDDGSRRSTDRDGMASDEHVPAGQVRVVASAPGHSPRTRTVPVTAGERHRVTMDLPRETLTERLARARTTFRFDDAPLTEVVRYVADTQTLNIIVMPDLIATLDGESISISVTDSPVDDALRKLCDAVGGAVLDIDDERGLVLLRRRAE